MERMNDLLEKYFRGETSLTEEAELKHYFVSNENVSAEHEAYRDLFVAFDQEKQETLDISLSKVLQQQHKVKRFWIRTFSYSGIAAALVLALWIQRPQQEKDYAIMHGRRIDDPEYAQKYAEKKMNDVNEMIQNGLKPLRNMEAIKENLRTADKNGTLKHEILESDKNNNINN